MKLRCSIYFVSIFFFVFMAIITAYSVSNNYNNLTCVELTFAEEIDEKTHVIPLSSIYTDDKGRNFVFFVIEQDGAWGKEYVCKKNFLYNIKINKVSMQAIISGQPMFSNYPYVMSSSSKISDGERVRFIQKEQTS